MNPLDQLRDLHLPPPPGIWPLAPGWWLLIGLALVLAGLGAWLYLRRRRHNAYRRAALARAEELQEDSNLGLVALVQLVRRTALSASPASPLAALPGPDLMARVDSSAGGEISRALGIDPADSRKAMEARLYGHPGDELTAEQRRALVAAVRRWIRRHRREELC